MSGARQITRQIDSLTEPGRKLALAVLIWALDCLQSQSCRYVRKSVRDGVASWYLGQGLLSAFDSEPLAGRCGSSLRLAVQGVTDEKQSRQAVNMVALRDQSVMLPIRWLQVGTVARPLFR
jgi:hypothetical protein